MSQVEPLVEEIRGGRVESVHYGAVAVVDRHGRLAAHVGDAEMVMYPRSSLKPLQLIALVESGGADHFGFDDRELAVMAASHSADAHHLEAVQGILDKIGLGEEALLCGAHWPSSAATSKALRTSKREPTAIHNNCSGKHAGMLAYAKYRGEDVAGYIDPLHPIQATIRQTVAEMAGIEVEQVGVGIDGCSAPTFSLPLRATARAYAHFADPATLSESRRAAIERIARAMAAHPEMISGAQGLDCNLIGATNGQVLSKGGAEAFQGLAVRRLGLGVAIKVIDGNYMRGIPPAAIEVLRQLGALEEAELAQLSRLRGEVVTNHRGLETGEVKAVVQLRRDDAA
jgi:L-asparaginase II